MSAPLRLAFLGCGFITRVHSRHLKKLGPAVVVSYAARDRARAEAFCREFSGARAYGSYEEAIADPAVDAVVVAVPTAFHRTLTEAALAAGKHAVVEKPAFPTLPDFEAVRAARDRAGRVVLVGENDHYKPLAIYLRKVIASGALGELVFAQFSTIARRLKTGDDWRNDEAMAGGDAFFEEGIHWLHLAGSLGPRIIEIDGYRPDLSPETGPGIDRRRKSMLVAFRYDTGAVGTLYYSREIPSLLRGLRLSKLMGRRGVVSFESNGTIALLRGEGHWPVPRFPGFRDIRGYQAMYRDFLNAVRERRQPEMSLERAIEDQRLMERVCAAPPLATSVSA